MCRYLTVETTSMNCTVRASGQLNLACAILIALACSAFFPTETMAQSTKGKVDIKEVIWGFNGRIQPGQFNVVSILLDNGTGDPVDGQLRLQKSNGMLSASGIVYDQTTYIDPAGRRWVQFYPYITEDYQTNWRLTYVNKQTGVSKGLGTITQSRQGSAVSKTNKVPSELVQVIALLPDDVFRTVKVPPNLSRFPDNVFPPYATATTALHTAFLDHEPNWDEPRQQAFMSWLRLGGNVHILKSRNNQFPNFSGNLADLQQPLSEFHVGQGMVRRHDIRLSDLSDLTVENAIRNGLTFDRRLNDQSSSNDGSSEDVMMAVIDQSPSGLDMNMYQQLQERTQPDHAWWLIYLLAIAYILLIFPGCYIISKNRKRHFLTTYAAIAGLSVLFSVLFLFIGQRGYGESTWMQTLAIAKVADDGELAVQQWSSLFVTSGNQYLLTAPDSQAVLNAGVGADNTRGQTTAGKDAMASVRIPPYSAQTINAARHLKRDPWELKLVSHEIRDDQLVKLSISTQDSFPATDDKSRFYAISGNHIYTMKFNATEKLLNLFGNRRELSDFCQLSEDYRFRPWGMQNQIDGGVDPDELFLNEIVSPMTQRTLLLDRIAMANDFIAPNDRIRLLVLTAMPSELDLQITSEARHSGWMMYSHDLIINR